MPSRAARTVSAAAVGFLSVGLALSAPASPAASTGPVLLRDVRASVADVAVHGVRFPIDTAHPQPDTEIEPSIAVNPADPLNAVAVFQEDRVDNGGDADNGFAATFDGGRSWIHGYLPGMTRATGGTFDRASDAVVTFGIDPDNHRHYLAYANSLVFDDGSGPSGDTTSSGMAVNVSKDGGRTWSKAVVIEQDGLAGLNDKNWIVVDNGTGAGHRTGRVYVMWDRLDPMVYTYCDSRCDQLSRWSSVNNMTFYPFAAMNGIGAIPLVLTDGSLGVVFEAFPGTPPVGPPTDQTVLGLSGTELQFALAKGAGLTPWPAPLPFPQVGLGIAAYRNRIVPEQRAATLPAAAIDPQTGQIYVAWEDGRFRTDGHNDIVFSTSSNGITWSAPRRVNINPENDGTDRWNATVSVGVDGVVHISYRERDEHTGRPTPRSKAGLSPYINTYYQQSLDHGATWSAPLQVNRVRTDVGYAAFSRGGAFLGDYDESAAASNATTYVVRAEALPSRPGEPCNCSFTTGNGHQHQFTYVAVIGDRGAGGSSSPIVRQVAPQRSNARPLATTGLPAALPWLAGALLLLGLGLGSRVVRRRRST
jgi:hypothetical protein